MKWQKYLLGLGLLKFNDIFGKSRIVAVAFQTNVQSSPHRRSPCCPWSIGSHSYNKQQKQHHVCCVQQIDASIGIGAIQSSCKYLGEMYPIRIEGEEEFVSTWNVPTFACIKPNETFFMDHGIDNTTKYCKVQRLEGILNQGPAFVLYWTMSCRKWNVKTL